MTVDVTKARQKVEYGDFQTPRGLAAQACSRLIRLGVEPSSILEPNCGEGSFVLAALEHFPDSRNIVGIEINEGYVNTARSRAATAVRADQSIRIVKESFFNVQWVGLLDSLPDPLLILGNPPWVTNAQLGSFGSANLPAKSNFQRHRGIDAITGKSNFDISEWMLSQELEWIGGRQAVLAMLCKTTVARKVLRRAWKQGVSIGQAHLYLIDANRHFGATVDACFLVVMAPTGDVKQCCQVYESLEADVPTSSFGYRDNRLISDVRLYDRWKHLHGEERLKWRSGIKHDCSKVMELQGGSGCYRNGFGEVVELEPDYVYPMMKSSDLANVNTVLPTRHMLVTQRHIGEETRQIREMAPRTWHYLLDHADLLDRRSSLVYQNRPRFSVFGIGEYSFAEWKVAIAGFYKKLQFRVVGPFEEKPVVLDDTCYFIACNSKQEAQLLCKLLNSEAANRFFSSLVFWDEKRPITSRVLSQLDVLALARELRLDDALSGFLNDRRSPEKQLALFA